MALPFTGIDIQSVKNTLGVGFTDLINLCTSPNINPWSKYRPGYLYNNSGHIGYQAPRGHAQADPRGGCEDYSLGDFRGYNHNAQPPKMTQLGEIEVSESSTHITASFNMGSLDIDSVPEYRHASNDLGVITHFWIIVNGNSFMSFPVDTMSPYVSVEIPISPSGGNTYTYLIEAGLGHSSHYTVKIGTLHGAIGSTTARCICVQPARFDGIYFDSGSWDLPSERINGGEYIEYVIVSQTSTISPSTQEVTSKIDLMEKRYYDGSYGSDGMFDCYGDIYMKGFKGDNNAYLCQSNVHIKQGFNITCEIPSSAPRHMFLPGDEIRLLIKNATSNSF